jgi:hypothetical protein
VTAQIVGGFHGGVWGNEYLAFQVGSGGASNDGSNDPLEKLRILGNGNVGIGTMNAGGLLEIYNSYSPSVPSLKLHYNDGTDYSLQIWPYVVGPANVGYAFKTQNAGGGLTSALAITGAGNVGIGTTSPQYPLSVSGTIQAKEVLVNTGWSDYVFSSGYRLRPLTEVKAYVQRYHHLPDIPSAKEVAEKGVNLGEMQAKLLAKVEELTLHVIQADERNSRLEQQNRELQERLARLEARELR